MAAHSEALNAEATLRRIASTAPCTHCSGAGLAQGCYLEGPCQHCDGLGWVPTVTARQAAMLAAAALRVPAPRPPHSAPPENGGVEL